MGKHKKNKREQEENDHVLKAMETSSEAESHHKVHKKKSKKEGTNSHNGQVRNGELESGLQQLEAVEDDCQIQKSKKKKSKKKKHEKEDSFESETTESCKVEADVNGSDEFDKHKHKSKKKKKEKDETDVCNSVKETNMVESFPKKRKLETEDIIDEHQILSPKTKKKKDKRTRDVLPADTKETQNKKCEDAAVKKKKKKKKHKHNSEEETNEPIDNDAEVQNQETGSAANVNRESKQPETERETSGRENQPVTGQWNTASLGDEDRQNKFLRLLGGFKKGNSVTDIKNKFGVGNKQSPLFSGKKDTLLNTKLQAKKGGNFAMNKTQEEDYVKNMEKDYERAMSCNLNRGLGLGFQKPPDQGKKFYIDTNKSKSVKFDDSD